MMKVSIGDWVRYRHPSGIVIMGGVKSVGKKVVVVSDWLSDEVISRDSIVEVRKKAVKP